MRTPARVHVRVRMGTRVRGARARRKRGPRRWPSGGDGVLGSWGAGVLGCWGAGSWVQTAPAPQGPSVAALSHQLRSGARGGHKPASSEGVFHPVLSHLSLYRFLSIKPQLRKEKLGKAAVGEEVI